VSRPAEFEEGYAIVRVDPMTLGRMPETAGDLITVNEIWWTLEEAEAEVDRLNALSDDEGSPYFWQYTRVRRRF
jgi:hypothetical protein